MYHGKLRKMKCALPCSNSRRALFLFFRSTQLAIYSTSPTQRHNITYKMNQDAQIESAPGGDIVFPRPSIIVINGFPGSGKFTVSKALKDRFAEGKRPCRLVDNHLLIDAVEAIEPERGEAHYKLRSAFRQVAIQGLKTISDNDLVIMYTAALSSSPTPTPYDDIEQLKEYVGLAKSRNVPLLFVNLICDGETNQRRLCSEERQKGHKRKLTDAKILDHIRQTTTVLKREEVLACGEGQVVFFEIDNSKLSIEEQVRRIWLIACWAESNFGDNDSVSPAILPKDSNLCINCEV